MLTTHNELSRPPQSPQEALTNRQEAPQRSLQEALVGWLLGACWLLVRILKWIGPFWDPLGAPGSLLAATLDPLSSLGPSQQAPRRYKTTTMPHLGLREGLYTAQKRLNSTPPSLKFLSFSGVY